jgi:hypothetical protein
MTGCITSVGQLSILYGVLREERDLRDRNKDEPRAKAANSIATRIWSTLQQRTTMVVIPSQILLAFPAEWQISTTSHKFVFYSAKTVWRDQKGSKRSSW